ncbi:protein ABHD18 isoform X2 [Arctopsyche grandis]|uniref:protein ABHD18 isoform X2 n=1 Tax=Arctopsyche grandis TaxID=121162 RepID=UPI00406D778A
MSASRLDAVYRSILITKFFTKGWGKPDNLRRLFEFRKIVANREECYKLISPNYPITITKEEKRSDYHLLEGHFLTPMELFLPGVVPPCARQAHFQIIMPATWSQTDYKPMCVHLAGTGDHFFWRRRNLMAKPLLKEGGIGAIILENPFYGLRKPQDQVRSALHNVSDIFVMGGCLILETLVLLRWCERNGLGPLGVTGLSMGGHMASLAATNWPKPLVLVPCLSWSTASAVFTKGVMSNSINWELLETQFFSDGEYRDKLAKMVTIVDEAFLAGRKFAQHFSTNSNKDLFFDLHSLNLPKILKDTNSAVKNFDITNPDNLSSCRGFLPEENQNYSMIKKNSESSNVASNNAGSLKTLNQKITTTLYEKITSTKNDKKTLTKNILSNIPFISKPKENTSVKWRNREALQFMRGVMDEFTHLGNFSIPYDTSLIIAVCAKNDAYVPRGDSGALEELWPGAEVRYIDAGHVTAYVLHQRLFRSCIVEAFERSKSKWQEQKET